MNRLRKHRFSTMKMVSFTKEIGLGQVVFIIDVALVVVGTFGLLERLLVGEGPLETWFVSRFAVGTGERFVCILVTFVVGSVGLGFRFGFVIFVVVFDVFDTKPGETMFEVSTAHFVSVQPGLRGWFLFLPEFENSRAVLLLFNLVGFDGSLGDRP